MTKPEGLDLDKTTASRPIFAFIFYFFVSTNLHRIILTA